MSTVGFRVYEFKTWPIVPSFVTGEVIQCLYGLPNANRIGKPSANSFDYH